MKSASFLTEATSKAAILVEALPYIRAYRDRTFVLKLGGEILEDLDRARLVADDIALMSLVGIRIVVVHGGGPQVSRAMEAAGITPRFSNGLRVTDASTLEVVMQVLIGSINPRISTLLNNAGAPAFGCSAFHGGTIVASLADRRSESLGRVGEISAVMPETMRALLDKGYVPVVAPIATAPDGDFLNVNADEVAGALASALQASKLVFLSNTEGIYRDLGDGDSLISQLQSSELRAMLPTLTAGMRPKATAALAALDGGVPKVHVLDGRQEHALLLEVFTDHGVGTEVTP